jgi:hypothetical protein
MLIRSGFITVIVVGLENNVSGMAGPFQLEIVVERIIDLRRRLKWLYYVFSVIVWLRKDSAPDNLGTTGCANSDRSSYHQPCPLGIGGRSRLDRRIGRDDLALRETLKILLRQMRLRCRTSIL